MGGMNGSSYWVGLGWVGLGCWAVIYKIQSGYG